MAELSVIAGKISVLVVVAEFSMLVTSAVDFCWTLLKLKQKPILIEKIF